MNHITDFTKERRSICETFDLDVPEGYLQQKMGDQSWAQFVTDRPNVQHKVQITWQDKTFIFSVTAADLPLLEEPLKAVIFTDITELEAQKKQTESIFSGIMHPIMVTEKATGFIQYANSFAYKQYEVAGDLVGTRVSRFYVKTDQKAAILQSRNESKALENMELQFKTEAGKVFDGLLTLQSINYEGKDCYLGMVVDVTVQKEQQRALESAQSIIASEMADRLQSETMAQIAKEQLENMTNAIPGVVLQFKLSENLQHASYISQNIDQLHGITPESVNESLDSFYNSIHEDDRHYIRKQIDCDASHHIDTEYRVLQKDGGERWMRFEASISTVNEAPDEDDEDDIFLFDEPETESPKLNRIVNGSITDITDAVAAKHQIHSMHKHTRDSIEYAALIQRAIVPDSNLFERYFDDYFTSWEPKDIVGGDIFLFEELRHKDECLIFVIDCTGHGVPGAFVTMLVKAIERQVEAIIKADETLEVSPAWILQYFNKHMRMLLKQDCAGSESNAGFDGGIIYYNRAEKVLKYSGAETPLFYIEDDVIKTIKGSRHSVGYKKSNPDYQFKEHTIAVKPGMQFYLSTDGILDQNGGDKSFPYGKKRFSANVYGSRQKPFLEQKQNILDSVIEYQGAEDRNDDMCVVGFKI